MADAKVVVVGAGMAGLACALELKRCGVAPLVLEASNRVGGRVGGDIVDGHILDRGFQVLLTAYPTAARLLDYGKLDLREFYSGAFVRRDGGWHRLADPRRHPLSLLEGVGSPLLSLRDAMKLRQLLARVSALPLDDRRSWENRSTFEFLYGLGLGRDLIDGFFRPFFGGVFFDRNLETSTRMLFFTLRMFAQGRTVLPRLGMQRLPDQLWRQVGKDAVLLEHPVDSVAPGAVTVGGRTFEGDAIVLATEGEVAARLLGEEPPAMEWRSTATLHFGAPSAPVREPILHLDGDGRGPINHLAIPSNVSDAYAPPRRALICANTVGIPAGGDDAVELAARSQLTEWFGPCVSRWELLRIDSIERALPVQTPLFFERLDREAEGDEAVVRCGDYLMTGSIDGALESGVRAAKRVLSRLSAAAVRA